MPSPLACHHPRRPSAIYEKHQITCATAGTGLRFAPHVCVTMSDIEKAVEAVGTLAD